MLLLKKRALIVEKVLTKLFPCPTIPLIHQDPYTLLIAVLLSARCADAKVNQITPVLFTKASNPFEMVKLTKEEIQHIIKPCGLSSRKATYILELSKVLLMKHKGRVPDSLEQLERLPGVGHKTASVVLIQAFQLPAFPVDTHIFRCARRWGLSQGKNVDDIEKDLKYLFPKEKWSNLHLQILYYAREFCKSKHVLEKCEICQRLSELNKS